MSVVIYAKPGTHSASYMRVYRKRKKPIAGEVIKCKYCNSWGVIDPNDQYVPWSSWIVREIVPETGMYMLERF